MLACVQKLINIARAEIGYLEKASNSQLDDPIANAGTANYTKYARDLDAISGFFNGKKNGYAWCAVFVSWCFVQAFGVNMAKALTCQPVNSGGAGVGNVARYFQNKGQYHKQNPQPGDVIVFLNASGGYQHVGLVVDVDDTKVYTVEGNTSSASGVVANGGCVRDKSYSLNYSRIHGYGRPNWSLVSEDVVDTCYSGNRFLTLEEMQVNARYIYQYLSARGWTLNAIAGMLGNMQTESTINPGIWQSLDEGDTDSGYGLVQWTPATKYLNWCNSNGLEPSAMDSALKRLEYELANGLQFYATDAYPLSFASFKVSTKDPGYLALAFLANYERPADPDQPNRATQAEYWYNFLSGYSPGTDWEEPREEWTPPKKKKMSLLLYVLATKRKM